MPFKTTPRRTRSSASIKSADHWAQVRQHLSHSGFVLPTDAIGAAHHLGAAGHPRQTGVFYDMNKPTGCCWNLDDASLRRGVALALNPIGRFYRHNAMHAGTTRMVLDDLGRCAKCVKLGFWKPDA
jgi:hypothetical protein